MRTIYKYPIIITDEQTVLMHQGAKIIEVAVQHEQITLWAIVNAAEPLEARTIIIRGTGHPMPDDTSEGHPGFDHLGTVQQDGFVWHVFEPRYIEETERVVKLLSQSDGG